MKTEYKNFEILVDIEGKAKRYEFPAVSIEAAMADIKAGVYGEVRLVQYMSR